MKAKNKKKLFCCIKLKSMLSFCFACLLVASICFYSAKTEFVQMLPFVATIVIDPGHGGVDGGCVGKYTGVKESDLNLIYAKNLKQKLIDYGFRVVMTRNNREGLYDVDATNLKKSDMKKRKQIIEESNADIVISIHMNSYPAQSAKGSQVFFDKDSDSGNILATSIQEQLKLNLKNTSKVAKIGDYYITSCTKVPSCLVECGFVSNKEEELLLQDREYQDKLCYAILCGVLMYYVGATS